MKADGDGWVLGGCPVLLVVQRYMAVGVVRVQLGFYSEFVWGTQGSPVLWRQVENAGGVRPTYFLNHHRSTFLLLLFHLSFQLEDTLASLCRSLSFCWNKNKVH